MEKYDKIFITSLPSFYKLKLWNEVSKQIRVFVIFTTSSDVTRNQDFYNSQINFDHVFVEESDWKKTLKMCRILLNTQCKELVIGGWDRLPYFVASILFSRKHNSTIVESAIFESRTTGVKAFMKRLFLKRMSCVYVPGETNEKLVRALGYKGKVVKTGGCGVLNYIPQPVYQPRESVKKFLFVGRLIDVKNLDMVISVFNTLPELTLTIVGFGALEQKLKSMAKENINFTGSIDNAKLSPIYQSHDVFILASKSESWGLVVEEALNNGLPVLTSNHVGCSEDLVTEKTGLIFRYDSEESLRNAILRMIDVDYYNSLRKNISQLDFMQRARKQAESFCY